MTTLAPPEIEETYHTTDAFDDYMQQASRYSLLSAQEEHELGRRYREDGDQDAREQLITHNLKLVARAAMQQRSFVPNDQLIDLIQQGNMGLMHAVEKFDYRKGHRFSTYATWWINQSIQRYTQTACPALELPVHVGNNLVAVKGVVRRLGYVPPVEELAELLPHLTALQIEAVLPWIDHTRTTSIDNVVGGSERSPLLLRDTLPDPQENDPAELYEASHQYDTLYHMLGQLPARERVIIEMRYGLADWKACTLEDVGKLLHITRERVRQLEKRAMKKLQVLAERERRKHEITNRT